MSDNKQSFLTSEHVSRFAGWLGLTDLSGAENWAKRLGFIKNDTAVIHTVEANSSYPYCPHPATVAAPRYATVGNATSHAMPADPQQALERAKALNDKTHWFTHLPASVTPTTETGWLKNVPIAVKDLIAVQGMPLSGGSASGDAEPMAEDAEAIRRLRKRGAVIMGMANLHELAFGATSENPWYGDVTNPIAPHCLPGGSSGGSAAVIAGGIVPAAIGTDTGGSVRLPAACCGVVGLKPSYDAVPRTGAIDLAPSLDHIGPLGRSVDDCASVFAALLDLDDVPAWKMASLKGVRVAQLGGYFAKPLDAAVRTAVNDVADVFKQQGAELAQATLQGEEFMAAVYLLTVNSEAAAGHLTRLQTKPEFISEDIRNRIEMGCFLPAMWYIKAQRLRRDFTRNVHTMFDEFDVLLCPTMRTPAPWRDTKKVTIDGVDFPSHAGLAHLTLPFNLTDCPAISIPWGASANGAPIGIQLVAAPGQDWKLLAIAERLESVRS